MINVNGNKGMERGIQQTNNIIPPILGTREIWEEEFISEGVMGSHYDLTSDKNLEYLAGKYKLVGKIKIKARQGKIVIEKI